MTRTILLTSALAVALTVAAACGGSSDSSSSAATTPLPTAAGADVAASPGTAAQAQATTGAGSQAASQPSKFNLNTVTREQILTIPNTGDRMVREFMEYRPYTSVQQFRREIGKYVSQDQVAAYAQYVYVPVDPNKADAETLRQIPGVDAAIAAQLIAARPYATANDFIAMIGRLVSADTAAAARAYLATS
jgi:DNA uptake protein ComE-like DNA-binding protein